MFELFGKHTSYIFASYAIALFTLSAMIAGSLWKAKSARKTLSSMKTLKALKEGK